MSRISAHDLPTRYQAQLAAQLSATGKRDVPVAPVTPAAKSAVSQTNIVPGLSKDEAALNKWEREYWQLLKAAHADGKPGWVGVQCLTFKLGDDCRYTPDFIVLDGAGVLWAHEVKGFMRDDALVKIKAAARKFSWVKFMLVRCQPNKRDAWIIKEISP